MCIVDSSSAVLGLLSLSCALPWASLLCRSGWPFPWPGFTCPCFCLPLPLLLPFRVSGWVVPACSLGSPAGDAGLAPLPTFRGRQRAEGGPLSGFSFSGWRVLVRPALRCGPLCAPGFSFSGRWVLVFAWEALVCLVGSRFLGSGLRLFLILAFCFPSPCSFSFPFPSCVFVAV